MSGIAEVSGRQAIKPDTAVHISCSWILLSQGYSEGVLRAFIRMASPPPPFARRDTTPTFGMRTKGDVAARQVAWLLGPRQGQLDAERNQQAATEPPEYEDEAHGCA